jgi:hypothetical protein
MNFMQSRKVKGLAATFCVGFALSGCGSDQHRSEIIQRAEQKVAVKVDHVVILNDLVFYKTERGPFKVDADTGLLPGVYTPVFRSRGGVFYQGKGRSVYDHIYGLANQIQLNQGGVFIPDEPDARARPFVMLNTMAGVSPEELDLTVTALKLGLPSPEGNVRADALDIYSSQLMSNRNLPGNFSVAGAMGDVVGLALVQWIISLDNGKIMIVNEDDGSTFNATVRKSLQPVTP